MNKRIKHFIRLYKINRLWGDSVIEAMYYSFRNKAFAVQFQSRLNERGQKIDIKDL